MANVANPPLLDTPDWLHCSLARFMLHSNEHFAAVTYFTLTLMMYLRSGGGTAGYRECKCLEICQVAFQKILPPASFEKAHFSMGAWGKDFFILNPVYLKREERIWVVPNLARTPSSATCQVCDLEGRTWPL